MLTSDDLLLYDWVGRGGVCDVHKVALVDRAGLDGVRKDGGLLVATHIFPQLPYKTKGVLLSAVSFYIPLSKI